MNARTGGAQAKPTLSPALFAVAVVLLVMMVALVGYRSLKGPDMPTVPEQHNPLADWIRQKAIESKGNINNLSAEDQARLQAPTQGKGAAFLKMEYDKYLQSQKK